MNTVILKCEGCGQSFGRDKKEHTRSQKHGRRSYCSLACLGKNRDNSLYGHCGHPATLVANNRRDDMTVFRWYMARIRYRSGKPNRGRKTANLTIDDLMEQWERQQGICPHTGWKLRLPDSTVGWTDGLKPDCASLDRIDSSQGYIKGNVVFVAVMYNYAKNAFSDGDVLTLCRAVAARAGG